MVDISAKNSTPIRRIMSPESGMLFYESFVSVLETLDYATVHTAETQDDLPNPTAYPTQSPPLFGIAESTQTNLGPTEITGPTVHIYTGDEWQDTYLSFQWVDTGVFESISNIGLHSSLTDFGSLQELSQQVAHSKGSNQDALNILKQRVTSEFNESLTSLDENVGKSYIYSDTTVAEKITEIDKKISEIQNCIKNPFYDVTILSTSVKESSRTNLESISPVQTVTVTVAIENTGHKPGDIQPVSLSVNGMPVDAETTSRICGTIRTTEEGITTHTENIETIALEWTPTATDSGSHTLTVATEDDSATRPITVLEQPFFSTSINTDLFSDTVQPGETVDVPVTVTNTGEESQAQIIRLKNTTEISYDDGLEFLSPHTELASKSLRLDPGESEELWLRWNLRGDVDPQSVGLLVESFDSDDTTNLTIEAAPPEQPDDFKISIDGVSTKPVEGDTIDVDFTVTNPGDIKATERVALSVGGIQRDSKLITLDAGESASPDIDFANPEFELTQSNWRDVTPDQSLVAKKEVDITVLNTGDESGTAELYLIHPVTDRAIDNVQITDLDSGETSDEYTLTWEITSRELGGTQPVELQVWEDYGFEHDSETGSVDIPEPRFELSKGNEYLQSKFNDDGNHIEATPIFDNTGYSIGDADVHLVVDGEYVDHQAIADVHPTDDSQPIPLTWGGAGLGETHEITVEVHDAGGVTHDHITETFETPTFSASIIETPKLGLTTETEQVRVHIQNESDSLSGGTLELIVDGQTEDTAEIHFVDPADSRVVDLEWEIPLELPDDYTQTVAASIDDNTTTEGVSVFNKIHHGIGHMGRYDHDENVEAWAVNLDKLDREHTIDNEFSDETTWEDFDENSTLINAQTSAIPTDTWPHTSGARIIAFRENDDGDRELYGLNSTFEGQYFDMPKVPLPAVAGLKSAVAGTYAAAATGVAAVAAVGAVATAGISLLVTGIGFGIGIGIVEAVYAALPDKEGETDMWMNLTWVQGESDISFAYENITMEFSHPARRDRKIRTTHVDNFFTGFHDDEHELIHASTRAPPAAGAIPDSVGSRVAGIDTVGSTTVDREVAVAKGRSMPHETPTGAVDEFLSGMWVPKSVDLPGTVRSTTVKIGTHASENYISKLSDTDGPTTGHNTRRTHDAQRVSLYDLDELSWNSDNVILSATVDYIPTLNRVSMSVNGTEITSPDYWPDETAARLTGIDDDHTQIGYEVAIGNGVVEVYLNLTWLEVE